MLYLWHMCVVLHLYRIKINLAFISVSSGMLSQDDFNFISRFDVPDQRTREAVIRENPEKLAKTFLNLLSHISKDTTIQYVLTLLDDILQVQHLNGSSKQRIFTQSLKNIT